MANCISVIALLGSTDAVYPRVVENNCWVKADCPSSSFKDSPVLVGICVRQLAVETGVFYCCLNLNVATALIRTIKFSS